MKPMDAQIFKQFCMQKLCMLLREKESAKYLRKRTHQIVLKIGIHNSFEQIQNQVFFFRTLAVTLVRSSPQINDLKKEEFVTEGTKKSPSKVEMYSAE